MQAYYTASALTHEHIDEVYTSPLQRARDTALTIVRAHPSLRVASAARAEDEHRHAQEKGGNLEEIEPTRRVATDARLMERNLGELQGKLGAGRAHGDIPGSEPPAALKERLLGFWADMVASPLEPFASDAGSSSETNSPAQASGVNTPTRSLDHTNFSLPTPPAAAVEVIQERIRKRQPRPVKQDVFARTILIVSHGAAMRNLVAYVTFFLLRAFTCKLLTLSSYPPVLSANLLASGVVQLSPELNAASDAGAAVGIKGRFSNCSITEIHWPVGLDARALYSGKVPVDEAHGTLVRWSDVSHLPPELEKQLVDNVDEVEEEEEEEKKK